MSVSSRLLALVAAAVITATAFFGPAYAAPVADGAPAATLSGAR